MASEFQLDVLVNPISNSSAASAMGAKDGQAYGDAFNKNFAKQQPLGRITGQVTEFQKSMEAANARVIAFGASAGSIYFVKAAFDKLISSTVQVEKGLANINAILNLGQTALRSFSAEMFKAASQTGQTFETASQVALEFARHGVSATETVKRMTSAMELMRISGLSAADSVSSITAAINAFGKEGLTSADIVNRLTAVDTRFAVSAQDLAKAIQRVGSTAEDAGVRFNDLLGFVTAAQTATARGGAVIGNAFKSIFTRLARPQVLDDLESIGVTTKNASGQILPMVTILKSLAGEYDHLSASQKSFITQAVGGVYQVNILKASLADLGNGMSIFDKASLAASNSAGLIDKRMESLNETLSSKLNVSALKVTELFSNFGNLAFSDSAKNGIDDINDSLSFLTDKLQDIKPDDSIGEKIGKTLGQGISRGIGDILSGPGLQVVTALAFKALSTLGKFTIQSGGEFLGRNDQAEKLKFIQEDIAKFIQRSSDAQEIYNSNLNVSVRLAELYTQKLMAANVASAKLEVFTLGAAKTVAPNIGAVPRAAGGYVPSFYASSEEAQARALGASAGVRAKWGQGTIGGQSFIMNNQEVELPRFGRNGDSAVLPTYNKGHVPNFAQIPIISKLVGRFLTNTINPYGYTVGSKIDDLKSLKLKDIFNALILDKESPNLLRQRGVYDERGSGGTEVRGFAFRKMFGLKPRRDVSDLITENKNKTYSFNPGTSLYSQVIEGALAARNPSVGTDHDVMGNFDVSKASDGGINYKDTWDVGLHPHEKIDYKGIFRTLKNFGSLRNVLKDQEVYGWNRGMLTSPLSNLLRAGVHAISSPITFSGNISRGESFRYYDPENGPPHEAIGHIPNFALDHVFSLTPSKRMKGTFGQKGSGYEQDMINRLPELGFTNIKHLSAINNNERADAYARYKGFPWLLDAKHTTGEMSKMSELDYKDASMRKLWFSLQSNPERLANLDSSLTTESLMKFGVIVSNVPNKSRLKNYEKAGIGYSRLAGGFVPNFVSDNAKAAMERAASYSGNDEGLINIANVAKAKLKQANLLSDSDRLFLLSNKDAILSGLGQGADSGFVIDALRMGDISYAAKAFKYSWQRNGSSGHSSNLIEQLSNIVKKSGGETALYSLLRGRSFAAGFIPNFSALTDAMQREMGAGYSSSQIRVGKDSSLISNFNPQGLGVYNSTEGSLSTGINLARGAGINPSTKGMARGYVPNFADASISLVLGMLQGSITDLSSKLKFLAFGYDKQIEKTRQVSEEYTKAVQAFQSGEKTFKSKTFGNVSSQSELESKVSKSNYAFLINDPKKSDEENKKYTKYNAQLAQREQLIGNVAFKGMFGAPLIGDVAGAAAKNMGYEKTGKALEDFSGGLTSSFQILSQFPNQLGVALAAGEMLNTFSKAISNAVTQVASYEKLLDRQNTNLEKMGSAANATLDSFTKLNQIYTDGISTMQDLELQQKRLDKALIDLTSVPGGKKVADDLRTATTDDQRRIVVARALDAKTDERDVTASKLAISKADASRRAFGISLGGNVFSYANDADKMNKQQLLRSSSATMQNSALTNINDRELVGRLENMTLTNKDVSKIKSEASKENVLGLDKDSLNAALNELESQLNNFKIPTNFEGGVEAWKKYQSEINQIHLQELALKNKYNQELQNLLGKGAITSSFNLKYAGQAEESSYRGQQLGLVQAQNQLKLNALTTNDYGLIGQNAGQKQAQIVAQSQHEQAQNTIKGAESINSELTKVFDKTITNQKTNNTTGLTEEPSSAQRGVADFLSARQDMLTRNPQTLINSASNPESFINNILGSKEAAVKGGLTGTSYETLATELSTLSKTPDFYNKVIDVLTANKNIAEKSKQELAELHSDTIAALKEASFKDLANALGGSELLKRGSAREKARELRKDEYILQRSNNPLARGEAAHDILANFIPEFKRDLNNPNIQGLYNTIQAGQQFGNQLVYGGTQTGQILSPSEMQQMSYAQTYGDKSTKPIQTPAGTPQMGELNIPGVNTSALDKSVQDAANALEKFKNSLNGIGGNQDAYNAELKNFEKAEENFLNSVKQKYFSPSGGANAGDSTNQAGDFADTGLGQQNILAAHSGIATGVGGAVLAYGALRKYGKGIAPLVQHAKGKIFGKSTDTSTFDKQMADLDKEAELRKSIDAGKMTEEEGAQALQKYLKTGATGAEELGGVSKLSKFGGFSKPIGQMTNAELQAYRTTSKAGESMADAYSRQSAVENILKSRAKPAPLSEAGGANYWRRPWKSSEATELSEGASLGGKALKYGGRALGGLAILGGAINTYGDVKKGDYWGAAKGALQTGLGFAGPVGRVASLASMPLDAGLTTLNDRVAQTLSERSRGKGLDLQRANIDKYKTLVDPTYGATYQTEYRDILKKKEITPQEDEFIKRFEKLTGSVSSQKSERTVLPEADNKENIPSNIGPITQQNIKIQDGKLTILLDLSKVSQQIQTMINASIAGIGKNNPPKVNGASA